MNSSDQYYFSCYISEPNDTQENPTIKDKLFQLFSFILKTIKILTLIILKTAWCLI